MKTVTELESQLEEAFRKVQAGVIAFRDDSIGHLSRLTTWLSNTPHLFRVPPGVGKTRLASELVNRLFDDHGIPSLYFVGNHDLGDARIVNNPGWKHWYGHGHEHFACSKYWSGKKLRDLGYIPRIECNCGYKDQFTSDVPTVTVLEHFRPDSLDWFWNYRGTAPDDFPAHQIPHIDEFQFRIIDEMEYQTFRDGRYLDREKVEQTADEHPNEAVQAVFERIAELMGKRSLRKAKVWRGEPLLQELRDVVPALSELTLDDCRWLPSGSDIPANTAPYLVPILLQEFQWLEKGRAFNPRVNLRTKGLGIQWAVFPNYMLPTIFLDGSADELLMSKAWGIEQANVESTVMESPDVVKTFQYLDRRMSKSRLQLNDENSPLYKVELFPTIVADLRKHGPVRSVGVVTFKEIEDELVSLLQGEGYEVASLHYYNLRSSNNLEGYEALVVLGTPIPNVSAFQEEARAFFHDENPLDFEYKFRKQDIHLRNGLHVEKLVGTYAKDERVQRLYEQKCHEEVYQALHRVRPNRVEDGQLILLYTELPIRSLPIDGALGRLGKATDAVVELFGEQDEVKVMQVVKKIELNESRYDAVRKWVARNLRAIAALSGSRVRTDGRQTLVK